MKTRGLVERCGMVICSGLPCSETPQQTAAIPVYTWLTRPHDEAPADILRTAGYDLLADMVIGHIREPEKQRAGVYGTARQMVSCLTDREVSRWVTPRPGATVDTDPRPEFVPEDFVRDLRVEFPEMKGLSRSDLFYMRGFAAAWPDPIVQQPVGQLPWGHMTVLLDKLEDPSDRACYASAAVEYGLPQHRLALVGGRGCRCPRCGPLPGREGFGGSEQPGLHRDPGRLPLSSSASTWPMEPILSPSTASTFSAGAEKTVDVFPAEPGSLFDRVSCPLSGSGPGTWWRRGRCRAARAAGHRSSGEGKSRPVPLLCNERTAWGWRDAAR